MKRIGCIAVLVLVPLVLGRPASAQEEPDLRGILPFLMLVIDTSGSMERLPACACTTPSCEECLPDCSLSNVNGEPPKSPPPEQRELKKNRWAVTLEALTGTFNDFECEQLQRTAANGATFDLGYYMPYHQPWDCESQAAGTACAFDSPNARISQAENGILDRYASGMRFGLMTFDGWDTYVGALPLVPAASFDHDRSNDEPGLWSYGGAKPFHYPGCETDYMMDTGARGPHALQGSLISLNSCTGGGAPGNSASCPSWCYTCDGSQTSINRDIQEALLSVRPYGGTPIAASLDDLYYHFKNDLTDQFGSCRSRFALLVTDGYPDDDYREVHCNCANEGDPMNPYRCGGDPSNPRYDPSLMKCPYPLAEDVADDLVNGRGSDPAMIERLFVVGLAVDDANVLNRLNVIADRGCNEQECDLDGDGNDALFANDLPVLIDNLNQVLDGIVQAVSRTVPAFAVGNSLSSVKQYEISTGFQVASTPGTPWTGFIERKRFICETGALVEQMLDAPGTPTNGDRFHDVLNARTTPRVLKTAVPPGRTDWDVGDPNGHLHSAGAEPDHGHGTSSGTCDDPNGCSEIALNALTPTNFGLLATDTTRRDEILNWMYGLNGSPRESRRLGDIYHSSPVVMGPPRFDTGDEAFNEFRRRTDIATRPLTLFVGSNDGILHAFSVEDRTDLGLEAGQEMWGFIPPLLLDDLEDNLSGHNFSMDGTPVVKNVYFGRTPGGSGSADQYHSVLITGMRAGGNAYIALDVTDPRDPKFLWQFTDPHMGKTFGQAAIGQAVYTVDDGSGPVVKEGAVAILPGGVGAVGALSGECNGGASPGFKDSTGLAFKSSSSEGEFDHRSDVRCWQDLGRALYFVEVETGRLLKKIHMKADGTKRYFPSPLVSTPAIYPADVGTLMTAAYIVDADGVIWRIDMSAPDQDHDDPDQGWTALPFHDIFWGSNHDAGELTYEAPLLSIDEEGRLIVIVGTGDNNNFVKPNVENRVVSLTEITTTGEDGTSYTASVNWELRVRNDSVNPRLEPSELVTGTMALFNGTLFFGTFNAIAGTDACDFGKGRIHAVHYRDHDPTKQNPGAMTYAPALVPDVAPDAASASVINVPPELGVTNLMLMGLTLTQRPNCDVAETTNFDVFNQSIRNISSVSDPAVYLVAQGSGAKTATSLLQNRAGSNLGSIELSVNKPTSLSRVVSWAASVD